MFVAAAIMSLIAAVASVLRGAKYMHEEVPAEVPMQQKTETR